MNSNTNCGHENLTVTGGIVRCTECHTFFHNHKDSAPRPGLVSKNQGR